MRVNILVNIGGKNLESKNKNEPFDMATKEYCTRELAHCIKILIVNT